MTAKSWAQRIVKIPNNTFADTEPISASQAFLARNNVCHLIDESPQLYVNWGRITLAGGAQMSSMMMREPQIIDVDSTPYPNPNFLGVQHIYPQEFALDWLDPERPANLMVLTDWAGVDADDGDITCRVVICPASSPLGSGQNAIYDATETSASTVLGSSSAFIDTSEHVGILSGAWQQIGTVEENGTWFAPTKCMLRLEVMLSFSDTPVTIPSGSYPITDEYLIVLGAAVWGYG